MSGNKRNSCLSDIIETRKKRNAVAVANQPGDKQKVKIWNIHVKIKSQSGFFLTSGVSVRRSGFRTLGPSSDETSCVRTTRVWTRPRTGRPCLEERRPDRPRRFPTPPWVHPALLRPSQTWPTPQCPPSPPYWPPSRAAWTSTNAGVHRRAP